jgi:DNA invertase Pin-like site-specific DNA recombinase
MEIGYARVSSQGQSLDVQLEQLNKVGCEKIYQEKASGTDDERPQLSLLIRTVRKGDTIIATKLDRICRSTRHLLNIIEELEKKGVAIRILNMDFDTSTPIGKLMISMLGAIATFEVETMKVRQKEGIARAKENGKYHGRKPTAMAKADQVLTLLANGSTIANAAQETGISIMSVHRIKRAA